MVVRSVLRCSTALAAGLALAACGGPGEQERPPPPISQDPTTTTAQPTTEEPFDPRQIDLANARWSFGVVGWEDEPVTVELADGQADAEVSRWEGVLAVEGEPLYVDLDGDGDDDAVAALGFSADLGDGNLQWVASSWYVWVNDGQTLAQHVLPLESAGDCADAAPTLSAAEGGGVMIEQKVVPAGSAGTCAEGPTGDKNRTVVLRTDGDGESWLVQTQPTAAYGGDCPQVADFAGDEVTAVVAPGIDDPVAPELTPLGVTSAPSWLDDAVPGWQVAAFAVDEERDWSPFCGWTQP